MFVVGGLECAHRPGVHDQRYIKQVRMIASNVKYSAKGRFRECWFIGAQ